MGPPGDWSLSSYLKIKSTGHLITHHPHDPRSKVAQSCLTLCDPMGCGLPGSSVHGIFQARSQGIFLTQGSNPGLPHCRQTLYPLHRQGSHMTQSQCLLPYYDPWIKSPSAWFCNNILLAHSHISPVTHNLWLLLCNNEKIDELLQRLKGPQCLKYLLFGPLQESFQSLL